MPRRLANMANWMSLIILIWLVKSERSTPAELKENPVNQFSPADWLQQLSTFGQTTQVSHHFQFKAQLHSSPQTCYSSMRFFMEKASRGAIGINECTLNTGLTKSSQDWSPVDWIGARPLVGCKRGERDQYEPSAEWNSTTRAGCAGSGTCTWGISSLLHCWKDVFFLLQRLLQFNSITNLMISLVSFPLSTVKRASPNYDPCYVE